MIVRRLHEGAGLGFGRQLIDPRPFCQPNRCRGDPFAAFKISENQNFMTRGIDANICVAAGIDIQRSQQIHLSVIHIVDRPP